MRSIIKKFLNAETISYLIFGVLTTIIDAAVFYLSNNILKIDYMISTVISWVVAVLFAYTTNKLFVFKSMSYDVITIIKEISAFFAARLFSLGFTLLFMFVTVEIMNIDEFISKLVSNVFVVIMNYFFSKLFIFKSNKNKNF